MLTNNDAFVIKELAQFIIVVHENQVRWRHTCLQHTFVALIISYTNIAEPVLYRCSQFIRKYHANI